MVLEPHRHVWVLFWTTKRCEALNEQPLHPANDFVDVTLPLGVYDAWYVFLFGDYGHPSVFCLAS